MLPRSMLKANWGKKLEFFSLSNSNAWLFFFNVCLFSLLLLCWWLLWPHRALFEAHQVEEMKNWEEGADAMLFFSNSISIHTINAFCLIHDLSSWRRETQLWKFEKYHKRFKFSSSHHIEYKCDGLKRTLPDFLAVISGISTYISSLSCFVIQFCCSSSRLSRFLLTTCTSEMSINKRRMKRVKTQEFLTEISLRIGLKNVKFLLLFFTAHLWTSRIHARNQFFYNFIADVFTLDGQKSSTWAREKFLAQIVLYWKSIINMFFSALLTTVSLPVLMSLEQFYRVFLPNRSDAAAIYMPGDRAVNQVQHTNMPHMSSRLFADALESSSSARCTVKDDVQHKNVLIQHAERLIHRKRTTFNWKIIPHFIYGCAFKTHSSEKAQRPRELVLVVYVE